MDPYTFFFSSKISSREQRKLVIKSPLKEALAMKNRQELVVHRSCSSGSQVALRSLREDDLSLELSSGEWHQWQATWNEDNKWTAQHVGPKIKQIELWTCRNQYLSSVIFHFSVHESSEVCIGIALCLAIRKKYKWHHREKIFSRDFHPNYANPRQR